MAVEPGIAGVTPQPKGAALILDEMFSAALAAALRHEGHDVVAVCEVQELRALSDTELFEWAAAGSRQQFPTRPPRGLGRNGSSFSRPDFTVDLGAVGRVVVQRHSNPELR